MPNLYYHDALKRGQKEFRACAARGEQPYLPVLSEFVGEEQLGRTVSLGTVQVPLEFVVGTKSLGRAGVCRQVAAAVPGPPGGGHLGAHQGLGVPQPLLRGGGPQAGERAQVL